MGTLPKSMRMDVDGTINITTTGKAPICDGMKKYMTIDMRFASNLRLALFFVFSCDPSADHADDDLS